MSDHQFDEQYFHSDAYADVSFSRYSQYWWSNRYYAMLAKRYGPASGRVLEVGCGLGHLLGWLATDYHVVGADINAWALSQARINVPQGNFCLLTAEDLSAFTNNSFHLIISKHVLEHLSDPVNSIAEMSRVLAPGGVLIVATPNLDSPMRKLKRKDWIGYKDPTHISLKPPQEWLQIIKAHGLNPLKVFSDGFWDAPYVPLVPSILQKLFFGLPGGLQAVLGWGIIPVRMGESLIVVAKKPDG